MSSENRDPTPTEGSAWAKSAPQDENEDDLLRFQQQQQQEPRPSTIDDEVPPEREPTSLPDRLTGAALATTLEILKQVGGVTLSATGALVAPPLYVTQTIVLPQLWLAIKDYLETSSPERLKDWFRIFKSSLYHVYNTLKNTASGHAFRKQFVLFWLDVVDLLSCDLTRQFVVDYSSTVVKFAELIYTPETKLWLDQFVVTICRFIDVIGDGRNKLLFHSCKQTVWKFFEVLADPAATTALAEVTAYLCYALEMEQLKKRPRDRSVRTRYQKATEQDRKRLDKHTTVEEAILSSLGMPGLESTDDDNSSLVTDWEGTSSLKQQILATTDDDSTSKQEELPEKTRKKIDKKILRDGIEERAVQVQKRKHDRTSTVTDDREKATPDHHPLDESVHSRKIQCNIQESPGRRRRIQVETASVTTEVPPENVVGFQNLELPKPKHPERFEGESSLQHFHRILDEILNQKRSEAVEQALQEPDSLLNRKPASQRPDATDDLRSGTIQERLAAIRSQLQQSEPRAKHKLCVAQSRRKYILFAGIGLLISIVLAWIGLGCFGLYVLLRPSEAQFKTALESPTPPNEIVVRVVREVLHVDSAGKVLGKGPDSAAISDTDYEKVANCIADAYN